MSLPINIQDSKTGKVAEVTDGIEKNGLVVATRPLKTFENKDIFFTNDTYGADMNQNVSFGGTPIEVHDGTDNSYWTGSTISGSWTFDTTDQAHTGTKSIDGTGSKDGHTAQLAKGSSQSLTGYTALSGWIYITQWLVGANDIMFYGYNTGTGLMIGNTVNLSNYINTGTLNAWQQFAIPLVDMELTNQTIDSFRIEIDANAPPDFYLDDIQIEETGTVLEYSIESDTDKWLHVQEISMVMIDAYAGTLADATMANLAYNKLLELSELTFGITYKHTANGETEFSYNLKNLADILDISCSRIVSSGSDGTNAFIKICFHYTEPIVLKWEEMDKLSFTISDNLSGLLRLRIRAGCKEEKR